MEKTIIGEKYTIHCYKHDGTLYKIYAEAILLKDTEELCVFGNDRTKVTEEDGRSRKTKEPAIMFFYKKRWFNIIGQMKKNGIYFYCNIASPYIMKDKVISFIDYDLDLRVFPDGSFKVLDRGEYNYHRSLMNYPKEIETIIKYELTNLIEMVRKKEEPFIHSTITTYHEGYKEIVK